MKLPVLLLIYNRPSQTKRLLDILLKFNVKNIYISIDGAKNNDIDKQLSKNIEFIIKSYQKKIWKINRLKKNYGCKLAVERGINWFFKNVESGIILEDDCIPTKSFFLFCEKLLVKYKNSNVKVISGNNFLNNKISVKDHYYYSRFNHCWGWATWRKSWLIYDSKMKNWNKFKNSKSWNKYFANKIDKMYWEKIFDLSKKNYFDSWAYPWLFSIWYNNGCTIIPKYNLVKNIGSKGTHNSFNSNFIFNVKKLEKKFRYPKQFELNDKADNYVMKNFFRPKNFLWPTRFMYLFKMFISNPIFFIRISFKKIEKIL